MAMAGQLAEIVCVLTFAIDNFANLLWIVHQLFGLHDDSRQVFYQILPFQ